MKNVIVKLRFSTALILLIGLSIMMYSFTTAKEKGNSNTKENCYFTEVSEKKSSERKENFLATWQVSKTYTLQVIDAMPSSKFNYKPVKVDSVRTFAQQFKHLGGILQGMNSIFLNDQPPVAPPSDFEKTGLTKSEIKEFVNASFDAVTKTVKGMSDNDLKEKRTMIFMPNKPDYSKYAYLDFMREHTAHHRAQTLVYLRLNRITPPAQQYFPIK